MANVEITSYYIYIKNDSDKRECNAKVFNLRFLYNLITSDRYNGYGFSSIKLQRLDIFHYLCILKHNSYYTKLYG